MEPAGRCLVRGGIAEERECKSVTRALLFCFSYLHYITFASQGALDMQVITNVEVVQRVS